LEQTKLKFPKVIQNKKTKVAVTIYGKSNGGERKKDGTLTRAYPFYRICWRVAGQRRMQSFGTLSEAKNAAQKLVRDLGSGSQVTALTPGQAGDARAALERLQGLWPHSLMSFSAADEDCRSPKRLSHHGRSLKEKENRQGGRLSPEQLAMFQMDRQKTTPI
jgi:hypothetical protein